MTMDHLRFGAYGLAIGLCVALLVWSVGWWRRREMRAEIFRLRAHLHTQMEITHEGNSERRRQLEQLRLENENLRISVKAWQQKPSRHELRSLQAYDIAVHRLLETTPGFSLAWESAMKEAEVRLAQTDRGVLAFARRFISAKVEPRLEAPSPIKPLADSDK